MKVKHDNNEQSSEPLTVLNKWKTDFSNLLNNKDTQNFDNIFLYQALHEKIALENNMSNENLTLNSELEYWEIERVVNKLNNKKATGIDNIPNEVLKNKNLVTLLWKYFSHCFNTGSHRSGQKVL